jgi:hypothetical protein
MISRLLGSWLCRGSQGNGRLRGRQDRRYARCDLGMIGDKSNKIRKITIPPVVVPGAAAALDADGISGHSALIRDHGAGSGRGFERPNTVLRAHLQSALTNMLIKHVD